MNHAFRIVGITPARIQKCQLQPIGGVQALRCAALLKGRMLVLTSTSRVTSLGWHCAQSAASMPLSDMPSKL